MLLYSNTILTRFSNSDPNQIIDPQTGTMIIGFVNFFSSLLAMYPVRYFKRRTLFVFGHGLIAVSLAFVALFAYLKMSDIFFAMLLLVLFVFQSSVGPLTWIYTSEIATNQGLGFAMFFYKLTFLAISLSNEFLMDSAL